MTPEISYANDVPLVPSVRPVVIVQGSDYDIGYQWYTQLIEIFGTYHLGLRKHKEFSGDEIARLKAYQVYIKKHTPEFIDYMRGMADVISLNNYFIIY